MSLAHEMLMTMYADGDTHNARIFDSASKVSEEQYRARRRALAAGCTMFELGGHNRARLEPGDYSNLDSIRARWPEESEAMRRYIGSLDETTLAAARAFKDPRYGDARIIPWHT